MKKGARRSWGDWIGLAVVLLVLGAGLAYLLWKQDELLPKVCQPLLDERQAECERRIEALRGELQHQLPPSPPAPAPVAGPSEDARRWAELTGSYPQWPDDLTAPRDCGDTEEDLRAICQELDRRPYIQPRNLEGGTFALLFKVGAELATHPPVPSGETRQPQALLANAFHLFRNLGKDRMEILREILNREEAVSEPLAMALYRWLAAQERCWKETSPIRSSVLSDYAAYLLNTLGGQGYIRRRSPRVAALATFYALITLDESMQRGMNPHGVDLRTHVTLCRELLKTQELVFKDRYLEVLQQLEARWTNR
jgi:hypothetical protein